MARVDLTQGKIIIKSNDNKSADKLSKELEYEKAKSATKGKGNFVDSGSGSGDYVYCND